MNRESGSLFRRKALGMLVPVAAILPAFASGAPAEAPGRMIDIGGHRLHIHCSGEGAPTVILDGGAGAWSAHYAGVQAEIAKGTRVCTYDRAGLGWSEAGPKPRTSGRMADELHALIHEAGIAPPIILAGHSLGGYNVRIYQARYPEEVSALVLLESAHPDQWKRLPAEVEQLVRGGPGMLRERASQARREGLTTEDAAREVTATLPPEARAALVEAYRTPKPYEGQADEMDAAFECAGQVPAGALPDGVPLVVLSAKNSFQDFEGTGIPVERSNRVWAELQEELTRLSRDSTHLFSEGTHGLHASDPGAIVSAVNLAVRKAGRRPPPLSKQLAW